MNRTVLSRGVVAAVALLLAGSALSGCADAGTAPAGSPTGDEAVADDTALTIMTPPLTSSAPLHLAVQKGMFEDAGLNVTLTPALTPSATVPALTAGTANMASMGTADVLQAVAGGIPLRAIASAATTGDEPDAGRVFAAANGDIDSVADLEGKTVAVGGLGGGGEASLRAALENEGLDSATVKFVEVPFDSMLASLDRGSVDAISTVEPFTTIALESGAKDLLSPGPVAVAGGPLSLIVVTEEFLAAHGPLLERFAKVLDEATEYAAENEDEIRALLPTYSQTPPEMADKMILPVFQPGVTADSVRIWFDVMADYGFLKGEVDVDELVAEFN